MRGKQRAIVELRFGAQAEGVDVTVIRHRDALRHQAVHGVGFV